MRHLPGYHRLPGHLCGLLAIAFILATGVPTRAMAGPSAAVPAPAFNDTDRVISPLASIHLTDLHNKRTSLALAASQQYYILVFLSPECPLCQNYSRVLNQLLDQYKGEAALYGIIPGKGYSAAQVEKFGKDFKVRFPLLFDPDFRLTRLLKATTTPEAFLVDRQNVIVYSGLIDNWAVSLGVQRSVVSEHYLAQAIDASLHREPVRTKITRPVGCLINSY